MLKKIGLVFILFCSIGFSQKKIELTSLSRISILTFGPGDDLYSKFGHTAIRIQEPSLDLDIVFDYGNFASFEDGFYLKFIQGQLTYSMGGRKFSSLIEEYRQENRFVREQMLNLTLEERKQLFTFLENNFLPENRNYSYDFFFDNCATKIPEILKTVFKDKIYFANDHLKEQFTFRQLIHQKVKTNTWSGFGIDLALGTSIDKKASVKEHMFLPEYVYRQLSGTTIKDKPLVTKDHLILTEKMPVGAAIFLLSPMFWLSIFLMLVLYVTFLNLKKNTRSKWLDFGLFFMTGAAGLLLFFLWFLTDHKPTVNNFNILWAFPLNLFFAFIVLKKSIPSWSNNYLWALLGLLFLVLIIWTLQIQIFSPLIIFILMALGIRYAFLLRCSIKNLKPNA
ncbi:DUF4105 domain-containing protein [Maribacter sp. 2304DJ31-5]|uniref:lipoprotein N-acyltransferase Lnb domain-containing protein n=1 Tax=Maribacter sp. 2304DJ31-5 TaxID=3386273 RepID=UPI0039BD4223